ncbi:MAG: tetratricopeptide repeat protein [Crocinitomicaceae bacterium]|nr:tetratricopeptide repeat protein [Crocinitomicaceae bacterium]MDG1776787.1 tetratricopeptide repeat protein [Crocinitomicaceae bacterium]
MRVIIQTVLAVFLAVFSFVGCSDSPVKSIEKPRDLNRLIAQFPDSVALLLERGNLEFDRYGYDEAMRDAAKAFRIDSNNLESRMLFAEVLNNRETRTFQDVITAQHNYKTIVKAQPQNIRALIGLAATYSYQQDFEKTFQYVNEALRINPKYRNAYVLKGTTYRQIGNMDLAKSSYQTAIQQDPSFFEAYFFLGQIYQSENNPLCIEYFTTALELKPAYHEIKYQLAFSKQLHNQLDGAVALYKEMAADTIDFYINRGLFHQGYIKQFELNDIDSAVFYYRSALKTEPRHVESWHNLGLCYKEQGNKTKALQSFAKALQYNPEFNLSREEAESLR